MVIKGSIWDLLDFHDSPSSPQSSRAWHVPSPGIGAPPNSLQSSKKLWNLQSRQVGPLAGGGPPAPALWTHEFLDPITPDALGVFHSKSRKGNPILYVCDVALGSINLRIRSQGTWSCAAQRRPMDDLHNLSRRWWRSQMVVRSLGELISRFRATTTSSPQGRISMTYICILSLRIMDHEVSFDSYPQKNTVLGSSGID